MEAAVAAGIIAGSAEKELEVISEVSEDKKAAIRDYLQTVPITIEHTEQGHVFDIVVTERCGQDYARVRIADYHTNICRIEKNGTVLYEMPLLDETVQENARADRSPGEFYQLDMEMAFASQEDVFSIVEQVLPPVFEKYGIYKEASKAPFVRIPYLEAMDKYGSDKPDLRIDLVLTDATEVMQGCGFAAFEGQTVKAIVVDDFTATRKQILSLIHI